MRLRGAMAVRGLRAALGAVRPRGTGCAAGLRSASKPSEPGPEPAGPVTAALYVHVSVGTRGWARAGLGHGGAPACGSCGLVLLVLAGCRCHAHVGALKALCVQRAAARGVGGGHWGSMLCAGP